MKDPDGDDTNWQDHYGTVRDLWHCFIDTPLYAWADSKVKVTSVELGYDKVRELFYEGNEDHFLEDEAIAAGLREEENE